MTIHQYAFNPVSHLHQSFMKDGEANYFAQITMEGPHSEHEDEKGDRQAVRPSLQQAALHPRRVRDAVPRAVDARRPARPSSPWSSSRRPDRRIILAAAGRRLRGRQPGLGQGTRRARRARRAGGASPRPPEAPPCAHAISTRAGDEVTIAEQAIAQGYRRIVAVGGDGTWSNVGNAILRSGEGGRPRPRRRRAPDATSRSRSTCPRTIRPPPPRWWPPGTRGRSTSARWRAGTS